jgi:hypothetical protein
MVYLYNVPSDGRIRYLLGAQLIEMAYTATIDLGEPSHSPDRRTFGKTQCTRAGSRLPGFARELPMAVRYRTCGYDSRQDLS